ncbi:MAG: DNA recombination protein RmuC [Neisseria sp.]|nr:DNA recombination protein RmuC [Neisseria sp.]
MNALPLWFYYVAAAVGGGLLVAAVAYWMAAARLRTVRHAAELEAAQQRADIALLQQQLHAQIAETDEARDAAATHSRLLDHARQESRQLATELATQTAHARRAQELSEAVQSWQNKAAEWREALHQAHVRAEKLAVEIREERDAANEKLQLITSARSELGLQFKELANQILEEKTRAFTEQNQQGISRLIAPVQEKMQEFSKLVQDTYAKDSSERSVLQHELQRLQSLNTQLNSEAQALTRALTGSNNKTQGMWGEMILEKILEHSGLRREREYTVQAALTRHDEGGHAQLRPDAVIMLPENHHIVIDAKVSLTAYAAYANAEDDAERAHALTAHIASIRRHIKDLSEKRYHELPQGASLDFVLMFIPVEPAYLTALQQDERLLVDAFDRQIMLVGPSTLLAVLRTIAGVWRYENQNRNAVAIAEAGGRLHDKFVILLNTLDKLGNQLNTAAKTHRDAMTQLSEGRGNLISRVKNLQELGAKTSKKLPENFIDDEAEGDVLVLEKEENEE